jgi:predicted N-acetyltransferase YhbS
VSSITNIAQQLKSPNNFGFVCESPRGHLLGAVTLFNNPHQPRTAVLANLVTDPRVRRKGVGRSLLQHVVAFTRQQGIQFLALQVDSKNAAAIGLYQALGFERLGHVHQMVLRPTSSRPLNLGTLSFREARAGDAGELIRLSDSTVPPVMRYADVVAPERFRPEGVSLLKRVVGGGKVHSLNWWVTENVGDRKLNAAIKLDLTESKTELFVHMLFDAGLSFEAGCRLIQCGLSRWPLETTQRICTLQSDHALTPLRILRQVGFQTERILMHMRLKIG